jgi:RAD51-like protein 2
MNGGVHLGEVTEFCGVPGVGKTQMSMQLALTVQIPNCFGGTEGQAVYIDTEGSFVVERVAQMAGHLSKHLGSLSAGQKRKRARSGGSSSATPSINTDYNVEMLLSNIFCFRVCDYTEQQALIISLGNFIEQNPRVRCTTTNPL